MGKRNGKIRESPPKTGYRRLRHCFRGIGEEEVEWFRQTYQQQEW
jgi:hypothetical protein